MQSKLRLQAKVLHVTAYEQIRTLGLAWITARASERTDCVTVVRMENSLPCVYVQKEVVFNGMHPTSVDALLPIWPVALQKGLLC